MRSKWAKQISPLNICSNCSPSPTQSHGEVEEEGEEEEGDEAEFHPQSLESMLEEEEEEEEEAEVSFTLDEINVFLTIYYCESI